MNEKIDIIKKCFYEMQGDYWRDEGIAAAERVAAEIARLKAELEKYKKESIPMKIKDQNHIEKKCPDGIIRECCYDEKSHKFVPPDNKAITTSEVCGICAVLKEKIDFWKRQFDLEVAGRRKAEVELEKRPEIITCGECKKWQTEDCSRRHWDENYIQYFYPEKDGYCEHGQRRESEESK